MVYVGEQTTTLHKEGVEYQHEAAFGRLFASTIRSQAIFSAQHSCGCGDGGNVAAARFRCVTCRVVVHHVLSKNDEHYIGHTCGENRVRVSTKRVPHKKTTQHITFTL